MTPPKGQSEPKIPIEALKIRALNMNHSLITKVEKILEGSLDSILSPSVKIQIMGWKVCLRCNGKTLLGVVNKILKTKRLLQCFALLPQLKFSANNLNFH